ncbi:dsDNA nuclease domain-containing protein [Burkholderia cenocepacia]|uniref:dsDNA nuclease domain-containing protein n=1 Tax=Burkholderia cenocepacia TaxID=95486 RepID=UPI00264F099D|nr:dsDNA nuclease domain-containing protein [Burkholderia cenocepacia]MDN7683140.1 dsDNA nuclease domain-containing protein [Burkholderia cenocepacia]
MLYGIVEKLETPDDFALVLEFKEDVAILDSSEDPTSVEFCQIKKNENATPWVLKNLHKRGAKRKDGTYEPSTLAKLYSRRVAFHGHPTNLRFISNAGFKTVNEEGGQSHTWSTKLATLHIEQQNAVQTDIGNQLGVVPADVILHDFSIEQTFLPLGEQDTFVAGKLGKLSEAGLLPFSLSKTAVAASMLAAEVQSRASNNSYARDFDELKARVITRKQSIEVLSRVASAKPSLLETLDAALQSLEQEKHPYLKRKAIGESRVKVCTDAADRTNDVFRRAAVASHSRNFCRKMAFLITTRSMPSTPCAWMLSLAAAVICSRFVDNLC